MNSSGCFHLSFSSLSRQASYAAAQLCPDEQLDRGAALQSSQSGARVVRICYGAIAIHVQLIACLLSRAFIVALAPIPPVWLYILVPQPYVPAGPPVHERACCLRSEMISWCCCSRRCVISCFSRFHFSSLAFLSLSHCSSFSLFSFLILSSLSSLSLPLLLLQHADSIGRCARRRIIPRWPRPLGILLRNPPSLLLPLPRSSPRY